MEKRKTNRAEGAVKRLSMSTAAFVLTAVLVFGCAVGGTLAWLTDKDDPVTNTFVLGQIVLKLSQAEITGENVRTYQHGEFYAGSGDSACTPTIEIGANSVNCYVFIKVDASANFEKVAEYAVVEGASGWTELEKTTNTTGTSTIYYRTVSKSTTDQSFGILVDNKVTAKATWPNDVSFEEQDTTLTFFAYAIQSDGMTSAADAWTKVQAEYAASQQG